MAPFKLTQRPASGGKYVSFIERGTTTLQGSEEVRGSNGSQCNESSARESDHASFADIADEVNEPTGYELENRAYIAGWTAIRDGIQTAVTEAAAMPVSQMCINDCGKLASLRCQSCGPLAYFCESCFSRNHSTVNIFHVPEKWEVIIIMAVFSPME